MGIIDNIFNFNDTIFLKESNTLENKLEALDRLVKEYPENEELKKELFIVKKGFAGEQEIKYQLSKANIGMYVIQDLNIEYEDLKAQIDFVVVTRAFCYFIECKNLIGNILINDQGDFIREYMFDNKKVRKGMYSPVRQVEAQRDVFKKIWNTKLSKNSIINNIKRLLSEKNFKEIHRTLVVASNRETIINTKYAPKDIKNMIVRSDSLINRIQNDLKNSSTDLWGSKKETERWANAFLNINVDNNTDYYNYYKNLYIKEDNKDDILRDKLIEFRTSRQKEMNIPAYYVFNNEELDTIIINKPRTIDELYKLLPPIKVKTHGKIIIDIIKSVL